MVTLQEALGVAYRGIMGGRDLDAARIGAFEKRWYGLQETARNRFTNPNLLGDGTWAEVRRNRAPIPVPDATWQTVLAGAGTSGAFAGRVLAGAGVGGAAAYEAELTAAVSDVRTLRIIGGPVGTRNIVVTPGETLEVSADVSISSGGIPQNARLVIGYNNSSNSYLTEVATPAASAVSLDPANPTRMKLSHVVPAGAAFAQIMVQLAVTSSTPAGTKVRASRYMAGPGEYLDGSTKPAGIVQPEDFRVRWLGTPNASMSVIEAERARGFTPGTGQTTSVAAIVSTAGGRSAVRVIRLSDAISQPYIISPAAAGSPSWTGILSMWRRAGATPRNSPAQLERATGAYEGTVIIKTSEIPEPERWKEARVTHPFTSNTSRFNLAPPTEVGESFWFGGFGLFAGDYSDPVFSGDTPATGRHYYSWAGAPNASESIRTSYV